MEFWEQNTKFQIVGKVDNIGAIHRAESNISNNQTKYVNTKYHFVIELLENRTVKTELVGSENIDSNMFTKSLG